MRYFLSYFGKMELAVSNRATRPAWTHTVLLVPCLHGKTNVRGKEGKDEKGVSTNDFALGLHVFGTRAAGVYQHLMSSFDPSLDDKSSDRFREVMSMVSCRSIKCLHAYGTYLGR